MYLCFMYVIRDIQMSILFKSVVIICRYGFAPYMIFAYRFSYLLPILLELCVYLFSPLHMISYYNTS